MNVPVYLDISKVSPEFPELRAELPGITILNAEGVDAVVERSHEELIKGGECESKSPLNEKRLEDENVYI